MEGLDGTGGSWYHKDFAAKATVTLLLLSMVSIHVGDLPVHAPDQPVKVELGAATAFRTTMVLLGKETPVGELLTLPVPVPVFDTLRVKDSARLKLARIV